MHDKKKNFKRKRIIFGFKKCDYFMVTKYKNLEKKIIMDFLSYKLIYFKEFHLNKLKIMFIFYFLKDYF